MHWLQHMSIRQKLQGIVIVTCGAALAVSSVVFAFYDRATFIATKAQDLSAIGKMIEDNSTAALTFGDVNSAREVLGALHAEPHVDHARIYDRNGKLFAEYSRNAGSTSSFPLVAPPDDEVSILNHRMTLFQHVILSGESLGSIYIESDMNDLNDRMIRFVEIASLVLLASLVIAYLMSSRLQRVISGPIQELANTALSVTAHENYSIRAKKRSEDEIGLLFDQFNGMLDRIQQRDLALQKAHDDLEKRVAERTSYLNTLIENSPLAIIVMDSTQHVTLCNPASEKLFQYTRLETIGKTIGLLASDDSPLESGRISGKVRRGEIVNLVTRRRRKDGSTVDVELHTVGLFVNGEMVGSLAIYQDISIRKRAEEELQRAKETAEAASLAKSEFLANMSHEIRTPLNGVIGMMDLALETDLSPEQREYLETAKMSGESLLTVINDILDFSKIEAGKIELESVDFNLRDCMDAALRTLSVRADEKGLELLCEVAAGIPEVVQGDPGRIRQVVINLVGNSIKFTNQGEVALKVLALPAGGKNLLLQFTVTDTGIGIAPEKLKLIFEPFAQADTSTTRKYGGTGLGLTISSRLVEMMGGRIWVDSKVGKGTSFHFTARLGAAEAEPIDLGEIAPAEVLRNVRALIVDDNGTNRRILQGMLNRWEMRAISVEGGEEALNMLSAAQQAGDPFALILTDMHMPVMDGFSLVERVRDRPELSAATIMMLTSAGHRGDAERCRNLGVSAYLLKPIRQSELREAIARVLGAHEIKGAIPLITHFSFQDARDAATSLRVLIAEDNPVNQRLASRLLEKRGHSVALAGNGREALAAIEKERFDIVLMDVQMPGMDGIEATAAIRSREKITGNHVPVIALTAHAMKGDQERCLAAGMDGYLTKPIRIKDLDDLLQKHLSLRTGSRNAAKTLVPIE